LSLVSGSLPPGLELEEWRWANRYIINGTPEAVGEYTFTVEANNEFGSDTKTFTIKVVMLEIPQITTDSLPNGKIGRYYGNIFEATDYAEWSVESDSLPPGFELRRSFIGGVPTEGGEYTFTVKARNALGSDTKTFTINIIKPVPKIITTSLLLELPVGSYYGRWLLEVTDDDGENIEDVNCSLISGSLPSGLELNSNCEFLGILTKVGSYTFTLKAEGVYGSDTKTFTMNVRPQITTDSLPNGIVNQYYEQEIRAEDRSTWSVESGSLPPGLELHSRSLKKP